MQERVEREGGRKDDKAWEGSVSVVLSVAFVLGCRLQAVSFFVPLGKKDVSSERPSTLLRCPLQLREKGQKNDSRLGNAGDDDDERQQRRRIGKTAR